jgi:hypothetical protein
MNEQNLRRRSLAELDDVIDEIIERNPEFVKELNRIVEEKRKEQEIKNGNNRKT